MQGYLLYLGQSTGVFLQISRSQSLGGSADPAAGNLNEVDAIGATSPIVSYDLVRRDEREVIDTMIASSSLSDLCEIVIMG